MAMLLGCSKQSVNSTPARQRFEDKDVLPLVRVRLYASGLGYFEREGRVAQGQDVLPVPAGHLDDALKTLVLFNAGDPKASVSFPSRLSPAVARARAGLPTSQEAPLSYDRLLVALRGEEVELLVKSNAPEETNTRTMRGRVIDVVAVTPEHPSYDHGLPNQVLDAEQTKPEAKERLQVLLLAESGEIVRLDAAQLASVRALDEIVARRLHAALSARLATRSNQHQLLKLRGSQQEAPVRLAYLAEAPTWRASYRLMVEAGKEEESRLQAWALVHNDTDEAWRGVKLELVDGRPNSFLFPMTAPRYERRDLETPDIELSSVPQLSTTTPDAMWGDFSDYEGETIARVGGGHGAGTGSGQGFGSGHGRLGGSHRTKTPRLRLGQPTAGSDLLWAGDLRQRAGVTRIAKTTTSLFSVASAIDIPPQHSAMVPFIDGGVQARAIVWFESLNADAQRAIGFSNNTAHTLPAGPLSVYGRGGFLGEAMLASLKPGGRQFAQIADEPDAAIEAVVEREESILKHVDFMNNVLRVHAFKTSNINVNFDNRSGRERKAYVGLSSVLNAHVEGCDAVDYDSSAGKAFAVFDLPKTPHLQRSVVILEATRDGTHQSELDAKQLQELADTNTLPERERAVLRAAVPHLEAYETSKRELDALKTETEVIEKKLERLRAHLDTLAKSDSAQAHGQLMERILTREDELTLVQAKMRSKDAEGSGYLDAAVEELKALRAFREEILQQRASRKGKS